MAQPRWCADLCEVQKINVIIVDESFRVGVRVLCTRAQMSNINNAFILALFSNWQRISKTVSLNRLFDIITRVAYALLRSDTWLSYGLGPPWIPQHRRLSHAHSHSCECHTLTWSSSRPTWIVLSSLWTILSRDKWDPGSYSWQLGVGALWW